MCWLELNVQRYSLLVRHSLRWDSFEMPQDQIYNVLKYFKGIIKVIHFNLEHMSVSLLLCHSIMLSQKTSQWQILDFQCVWFSTQQEFLMYLILFSQTSFVQIVQRRLSLQWWMVRDTSLGLADVFHKDIKINFLLACFNTITKIWVWNKWHSFIVIQT